MYRTLRTMILALLVTFLATPARASERTAPDYETVLQLYHEQEAKIATERALLERGQKAVSFYHSRYSERCDAAATNYRSALVKWAAIERMIHELPEENTGERELWRSWRNAYAFELTTAEADAKVAGLWCYKFEFMLNALNNEIDAISNPPSPPDGGTTFRVSAIAGPALATVGNDPRDLHIEADLGGPIGFDMNTNLPLSFRWCKPELFVDVESEVLNKN